MNIRHYLHQHPEISGMEKNTHDFIVKTLKSYNADSIFERVGGYGVIATFKGINKGYNIAFRADIDALPIHETLDVEYKSVNENISHKCGHDGHTAILLRFAEKLSVSHDFCGNIILIFQPEEETGYGAGNIIRSEILTKLSVDYIFGIHNLPGYPENAIVVKNNTFAAASCGMIVDIEGRQTHAAHPEKGINPAVAVAEIIIALDDINKPPQSPYNINKFQQATLIYTKIGEIAFGTSAGQAQLMTTLRAFSNANMRQLRKYVINLIEDICKRHSLTLKYSFTDEFNAVENDNSCVDIIRKVASDNNITIIELEEPFRWSEDFSNYLIGIKGAFFGIGSGIDCCELHNPNYDFPDSIIDNTVDFFVKIVEHFGE